MQALLFAIVPIHLCSEVSPTGDGSNALPSEAAARARLRRYCEEKAGGRLQVPQWLHLKWKHDQNGMLKLWQECRLNKDIPLLSVVGRNSASGKLDVCMQFFLRKELFVKTVEKVHKQTNSKKLTIEEGWFTETDMELILGWSENLVPITSLNSELYGIDFPTLYESQVSWAPLYESQ